ncbi:MAG: hypothetical protein OEY11_12310 [Gammaproteobacteria bacterium]|nr:hypothetical protein [Gammaproteobacteria bacterium]
MPKVPFYNDKDHAEHIGPVTIMPGGTRDVDPRDIPNYKAEEPAAAHQPSALDLLDLSVPKITGFIPQLGDDELRQLKKAEEDGKARTGVISALDAEILKRSSSELDKLDLASFVDSLPGKLIDELGELADLHANDQAVAAVIQAEFDRRNGELVDFISELPTFDPQGLTGLLETYADHPAYVDAIKAEIAKQDTAD